MTSVYDIKATGTGLLDTATSGAPAFDADFTQITGNWGKYEVHSGACWLLGWAGKPAALSGVSAIAYVCDRATLASAANVTASDIDFFIFSALAQYYAFNFSTPIRIENGLWLAVNLGNTTNQLYLTCHWGH